MLTILRQDTGRFDRRFHVGPAQWDFFDLLWIHEGAVSLVIGDAKNRVDLTAPSGVLIFPGSAFEGRVQGEFANASITHFHREFVGQCEYQIPIEGDALHVQNLIGLSQAYARRGEAMEKQQRLLLAILDCFSGESQEVQGQNRLQDAWTEARQKLDQVRGIADVAAFASISQSTFRALHREQMKESAGKHLKNIRLTEAERLLATTGLGLREISRLVGYGYPESLSAAFSKSRGRTPGAYRKWCKRFA